MSRDPAQVRIHLVEGLRAIPTLQLPAPLSARLDDPADPVALEDLGMDSLVLMELSIWIQVEYNRELDVKQVMSHGTVAGLARALAQGDG